MNTITEKQKRFCEEYLIDCNATQAAIRAGYSKKTAKQSGKQLLDNPKVDKYIKEQLDLIKDKKIADAREILEYLTAVMRGESLSEIVVTVGIGEGVSEIQRITKVPDEKERLKAAELLGKRFGLFTDKYELSGTARVFVDPPEDWFNTEKDIAITGIKDLE